MSNVELKGQQYEGKAVDQSNISAWDPQVFADMVDTAVKSNAIMRQLAMRVDRTLVGSPGSSLDVRERGELSAASQSENSQIGTEDLSHSKTNVSVSKVGKRTVLTREAEEDALDSQEAGIAEELGRALADKNDADAYSTVNDDTLSNVNQQTLNSAGTLAYTDIRQGRALVKADNYDPDALVIHPDQEADLLSESKFIDASEYADDEPIKEGEIGRILGLSVFVTTQAKASSSTSGDTQGIILDTDRAFIEVVKREPTVEIEFEEDYDRWQIVGTMRYGHAVINDKAICLLES